ncbi:MAG: CRISPR-associated RAMP protein [Symploca sp. SIO2G7]|nr:CRISPR-associated RAMP protein [Symploca sp. SIO2G7]
MFNIFKNRLELTGTLNTITALRISQGRSMEPIGSDLPVVKDALGQPLIPGSSFKGALRSRLESFLRGIDPSLANDPSELVNRQFSELVKEIKEQHKDNDAALSAALFQITDAASQVFGSPWQASKFQVRDLTVKPDTWFNQYQERDGVSIDRDTETAAAGRLYDFQVVPAGTEFDFRAIVENAEDWELGLLMIGLHQFETEQIPLGGGCSRGLGVVKLKNLKMQWINVCDDGNSSPNPSKLKTYLKNLVNGTDNPEIKDGSKYKKQWIDSFIHQLPLLIRTEDAQPAETNA